MIQQILNKNVLKNLADAVAQELSATPQGRRSQGDPPLEDFGQDELAHARAAAQAAQAELNEAPGDADSRRGDTPALLPQDVKAYMARSPEVSNLQSAAELNFEHRRPDSVEQIADDGRRGDTPVLAGEQLSVLPEYLADRRVFGAFEQTDVRWIASLFAEGMRKFRGRRPFVPRPVRPDAIALPDEKLRLIVVGDWGSGIPRAQKVGAMMRRELDAPEVDGWQRHVIHLGDVYYSGWKFEYRKRFLQYWPVKPEEKETIGSFNLNGNHDMYSGGWAYFDYALADERFAKWQGCSSLFTLANQRWQIFGLDSSYEDAALHADQAVWIKNAALPGRKTMLLSHHQYCSSFEKPAPKMVDAIQPVLNELDVAAWLWGHEHRCMTFKDVPKVRHTACIGHGGVPVYQTHDADGPIPAPGDWEYRDYVDGGLELWAKFGFVTLDFYGDRIHVRFVNEDGVVHHETTME